MADNAEGSAQHYQPEQPGMYELEFPAPQLSSSDGRGPVMIHALEGFSDAGHAIREMAGEAVNSLGSLIRRNPIPAVLLGVGFGFLLGQTLSGR